MRSIRLLSFAFGLAAAATQAQAGCTATLCSLNSGLEAQEVGSSEGALFDLRYERILQNQPRSGDSRLAVGEQRQHDDEVKTVNDNLVATLDYTFDDTWGATVRVPYVWREHAHIHNHQGNAIDERWDLTGLGDMQLLARYSLARDMFGTSGLRVGLKLPTGPYEDGNDAGALAERSLQLGSGTTDLIVGGYHARALVPNKSSAFGQLSAQLPLAERAGYRPGPQVAADLGLRYALAGNLTALAQINLQYKWHDTGAEAEPNSSGGGYVFFSPGVSLAPTAEWQIYGYAQVPLYQYVQGIQLTSKWAAIVGVTRRF